jgi:hypothetical protein
MADRQAITDFELVNEPEFDRLTFIGPGGRFEYHIRPGSQVLQWGRWNVRFVNRDNLELNFDFRENGVLRLRVIAFGPVIQVVHVSDFLLPERLQDRVHEYLNPVPAVIPTVEIPEFQQDQLTFEEIPNGTMMVDFQRERERYHRYYTRETFDTLIRPTMRNPVSGAVINEQDLRYYIAALSDVWEPWPIEDNFQFGGRRLRATRRTKRKTRAS